MAELLRYKVGFGDISISSGESRSTHTGLGYSDEPVFVFTNNDSLAVDAATAVSQNSYLEFSVSLPYNATEMTLTNLSFDIARGGASTPRGYVVRSSIDDFGSDIDTADIPTQRPTFTSVSIDLDSTFSRVTEDVIFRIYCYTPSAVNIDFDNFLVSGTISQSNEATSSITGIKDIVDAELKGQTRNYFWRKTSSQTTTAKVWYDLAVAPGKPKAKLWFDSAPYVAVQIKQSTDEGIMHGANVSPQTKYLRRLGIVNPVTTALPMTLILCDYLLYYPSIDDSELSPQEMDNTTTLPRYTDGNGVQMMAVSLASRTGDATVTVSYTNQDGVAGRTATFVQGTSAAIGAILGGVTTTTSTETPFIGLQSGDTGVRSVQSVTMGTADVGFFAIVLVKPLSQICIRGLDAPVEKDCLLDDAELPIIYDDAYLNFICQPQGTLATTTLRGDIKVMWN